MAMLILLFKTSCCYISGRGLILKHLSNNKGLLVHYYSLSGVWKALGRFQSYEGEPRII